MNIQVNYHSGSYTLEQNMICIGVATAMVREFTAENPSALGLTTQNEVVNSLAQKLLNNAQTRLSPNLHDAEIKFSTDILPDAMRSWAEAKRIFQIQAETTQGGVDQTQSSAVSFTPYTFANTDWRDVETITASKEGHRGVWFLSNAERGTVVLKGQEHAENQIMGNVFLRLMGMNVPDAKMIGVETPEGRQFTQLGRLKDFDFRRRNPDHYIIMDRVYGVSYSNLNPFHLELVQKNLLLIGELAAYDLLLGNFDRFQLDGTAFNSGNMMFQDGMLVAIDTDCVQDDDREDWTLQAFKKFIKTPESSSICQKLASKLGEHLGSGVDPSKFSQQILSHGVWIGIRKLLAIQSNMNEFRDLFIKECRLRGVEISQLPPHVEKHLNYLTNLQKQ